MAQTITLPQGSMWVNTPIYRVNGVLTYGLMRTAILPDSTDQSYVVDLAGENNLQYIASKLYNNPNLWWMIAELNSLTDPFGDVTAGKTLRVATLERINTLLTS